MYLAYRSFLNVNVAGVQVSENLNFWWTLVSSWYVQHSCHHTQRHTPLYTICAHLP
jgi:hypothetical protein